MRLTREPGILSRVRGRLAQLQAFRGALVLWTVVGIGALALVFADAALILPGRLRASAPWALVLCAAAVVATVAVQLFRRGALWTARLLERSDGSLGTTLTNAVQLSSLSAQTTVQEVLRRDAVQLGRRRAGGVRLWPVVRGGLALACGGALLALLAWGGSRLLVPELLEAVLPRFFDPHGDHPPYSRVKIDVQPKGSVVLYGGQCEVRAKTTGRPVEKLYLVARTRGETTRTTMFVAPDRSFFQTLGNLRDETEYYVTDGRARSHRYQIAIRDTPRITLVQVKTEFPPYTGLKTRVRKLTDESLCLPLGTRLTFRVGSNRPLASGRIALAPLMGGERRTVPLAPEAHRSVVHGTFSLTEPVAFTLSLEDVDGLASSESRQGRITILPDNRPRISVLEPGKHAVATPTTVIPVRVQAEDDYGVTQIIWFRSLNQSVERPFNTTLRAKSGPAFVEAEGKFDLRDLGVRPGDVIDYFFEAVDNYPEGPNIATSRLYQLQIISEEQYRDILRRMAAQKALFQSYTELGRWLRRLSERAQALQKAADKLAKAGGGTDAQKQALREEARALASDIAEYRVAVIETLKLPAFFDVESSFREALSAQPRALARLGRELSEKAGAAVLVLDDLRDLANELAGMCQAEEGEIAEPIRHIAAVARLLARADVFARLAQRQPELVRLARRFKDRAGDLSRVEQMELREIAHAQRGIRDALRQLVAELPELLDKIPPDKQYDELRTSTQAFVDAVKRAKIQEDLDAATERFSDLDGKRGFPPAQDAAEKMDKLVARLSGMPGRGEQALKFLPALSTSLGSTLQQILSALGAQGGASGSSGYGLFGDDVALYGPNVELAGRQGSGRGTDQARTGAGQVEREASDGADSGLPTRKTPQRVKLQRDARFPLRYRNLVGEYFRAIAETPAD